MPTPITDADSFLHAFKNLIQQHYPSDGYSPYYIKWLKLIWEVGPMREKCKTVEELLENKGGYFNALNKNLNYNFFEFLAQVLMAHNDLTYPKGVCNVFELAIFLPHSDEEFERVYATGDFFRMTNVNSSYSVGSTTNYGQLTYDQICAIEADTPQDLDSVISNFDWNGCKNMVGVWAINEPLYYVQHSLEEVLKFLEGNGFCGLADIEGSELTAELFESRTRSIRNAVYGWLDDYYGAYSETNEVILGHSDIARALGSQMQAKVTLAAEVVDCLRRNMGFVDDDNDVDEDYVDEDEDEDEDVLPF